MNFNCSDGGLVMGDIGIESRLLHVNHVWLLAWMPMWAYTGSGTCIAAKPVVLPLLCVTEWIFTCRAVRFERLENNFVCVCVCVLPIRHLYGWQNRWRQNTANIWCERIVIGLCESFSWQHWLYFHTPLHLKFAFEYNAFCTVHVSLVVFVIITVVIAIISFVMLVLIGAFEANKKKRPHIPRNDGTGRQTGNQSLLLLRRLRATMSNVPLFLVIVVYGIVR